MCRLNNMLLNNMWVKEKKSQQKLKKKTLWTKWKQNLSKLWYRAEAVLIGKIIALDAYIRKEEKIENKSSKHPP